MYVYSIGSNYYIGFVPYSFNNQPTILLLTKKKFVYYSIETATARFYKGGSVTANIQNAVVLPKRFAGLSYSISKAENKLYKEGIYLRTTKSEVTVIGTPSNHNTSEIADTFFAIPIVNLYIDWYTYYPVTVYSNNKADSSVVIVATTNRTVVNVTVPVSAFIKINNAQNWASLKPRTVYSYEIQRLQIIYIAAPHLDLTGTKVITNKPISLFSGHECAGIPRPVIGFFYACDHITEQIPPTKLWGTVHYFAPFVGRTAPYTVKIIAAHDSTHVFIYCNNVIHNHIINAGGFISVTYYNQEYCAVYSNREVLVAQFTHTFLIDFKGDPMMIIIPATTHFVNSITSSSVKNRHTSDYYINIIVLASYFQPEMISLTTNGGVNQSLDSQNWVPIKVNNVTHAYAAQVKISHDVFTVTHSNMLALMTLMVYGFYRNVVAFGHPGLIKSKTNGMYYVMYYILIFSVRICILC